MLVLTRFEGQAIKIGDDITIVITKINRDRTVSVGIAAPKNIPVHREEVYDRIQAGRSLL